MRISGVALAGLALAMAPAWGAWTELRHGPFIVYTDAGSEAARTALNQLEQLRYAIGDATGRSEPQLAWPVEVVVRKAGAEGQGGRGHAANEPVFGFSRAGYLIYLRAGAPAPEEVLHVLAAALLEQNVARPMAAGYEEAIAALYSTMRVQGARWTIGAPPAPRWRTVEWAVVHQLAVDEETTSRARVFFSNLANGAEEEIAWRNVFGIPSDGSHYAPRQRERARAALAAGQFNTAVVQGRLIPGHEMHEAPALPSRIRLLPGDLALARGWEARPYYDEALNEKPSAAGHEGRGLALLLENKPADARAELELATQGEDAGPRAFYELARLIEDRDRQRKLLEEAVRRNTLWAEPYVALARLEPGPARRAFHLKKAAELHPRDARIWEELARAQFDAQQFDAAERSMRAALADTPESGRAAMQQRYAEFQQERADAEAAVRKKERDEAQAEIEKVRQAELERIRAAERKANAAAGEGSQQAPIEWQDGPPLTRVVGVLKAVECMGQQARLVLTAGARTLRLLIADPRQVAVEGDAAGAVLGCGGQNPPRSLEIEYVPRADAQAHTAGDVRTMRAIDRE